MISAQLVRRVVVRLEYALFYFIDLIVRHMYPPFRRPGQQAAISLMFISCPCRSHVRPLPQLGQVLPYFTVG